MTLLGKILSFVETNIYLFIYLFLSLTVKTKDWWDFIHNKLLKERLRLNYQIKRMFILAYFGYMILSGKLVFTSLRLQTSTYDRKLESYGSEGNMTRLMNRPCSRGLSQGTSNLIIGAHAKPRLS